MRKLLILFFSIFSYSASSSSILQILQEDSRGDTLLKRQLKQDIGSVFPKSIKNSDLFVQAFESQDFKKALEVWQLHIARTSFSKSSTGSALYSYLLFKNDFIVMSLNHLLTYSKPQKIDSIVSQLWKLNVDKNHKVWNHFYFPITSDWQTIFSPEIVFKVGSKYPLDPIKDQALIESYLNLPLKNGWDSFPMEWLYMLSLLKKQDNKSTAKLLDWFLSQTEDDYRKDQIYLTIARLLADIKEFPASLHYYEKVKKLSYFWLLAQEESARILLQQNDYPKAYSKALSLSPLLFDISSSMFVVLAMSQLKNCHYLGAYESLKEFKKTFSQKNTKLKDIQLTKDYFPLIEELFSFHQSKIPYYRLKIKTGFYHLIKDKNLKNKISLYFYLKDQKITKNKQLKYLINKRNQLIKDLEKNIHQRISQLTSTELSQISSALQYFHIIEAEIFYHHYYGSHQLLQPSIKGNTFFHKDFKFPFNRDEVWLDELSNYQVDKNCSQAGYLL